MKAIFILFLLNLRTANSQRVSHASMSPLSASRMTVFHLLRQYKTVLKVNMLLIISSILMQ